jgi:Cu/Ag efflux pump CusA
VVVGGLVSTLVLTLVALPAVYVLAHRNWRAGVRWMGDKR